MSTHLPILRRLVRWWGSEAVIEPAEECRHVNTPANIAPFGKVVGQ